MRALRFLMAAAALWAACFVSGCSATSSVKPLASGDALYQLDHQWESRSISFENPTGAKGAGGMAENHLGVGRKGAPRRKILAGETVTLCDIAGAGTIRHIWMTGDFATNPTLLRQIVIRAWWDGQEHPSIESPLGDFMGLAHARITPYQSAVHSVGRNAALNFWLPMPFTSQAKITFTNESPTDCYLYYQIDYTYGDEHPEDVGRMHVSFRRENPTTLKQDFEILPKRTGKGRFMGAVIGVRHLDKRWWGEGEVKMYIDGDSEFPTICGTGAEDYICLSYGVQETPYMYHGCTLDRESLVSMYRWHIPDPIIWTTDFRVTMQQIGWDDKNRPEYVDGNYYERQDDWCAAAFWYEPVPSESLPPFPSLEARSADLYRDYKVQGEIREKWMSIGGNNSHIGRPITDELPTPDGIGRFNHFERGSIYWSPSTGAHVVHGDIREHWAKLGWETSHLGYPTSDEYDVPEGRRSDFQHGTITWHRATQTTTIP